MYIIHSSQHPHPPSLWNVSAAKSYKHIIHILRSKTQINLLKNKINLIRGPVTNFTVPCKSINGHCSSSAKISDENVSILQSYYVTVPRSNVQFLSHTRFAASWPAELGRCRLRQPLKGPNQSTLDYHCRGCCQPLSNLINLFDI